MFADFSKKYLGFKYMSISYKSGQIPLALIRGSRKGKRDGKAFFINEPNFKGAGKSKHKNRRGGTESPTDSDSETEFEGVPEIKVADGNLSMGPSNEWRDVFYVWGPAGVGKSVFLGNYAGEYAHKYPDRAIYCISRKSSDEAFEGIDITYIDVEGLLANPLNCDDFDGEGCLVIFDDIDSISPKALSEQVQATLLDLLNVGRSKHISVIVTSHLGSDYKRTRSILNECQNIVFFPCGSAAHQINYVLKMHGGLSGDQIKQVRKLPSRWVCLRKVFPPAIIYSSGAYLLNKQDDE